MNLIFRMSRLFVAVTLLAGPTGPVYAGSVGAPAFLNKGTPPPLSRVHAADASAKAQVSAGFFNLPLYFEANHGQTDPSVKFFTHSAGYNLYLTASQAVMVMPKAAASKTKESIVVRMKLQGADAGASVRGQDILPGRVSYFLGKDPSKWQAGVELYGKVKFSKVYPGIDVIYYGKQGHVEHDFVVAPGANPGRILIGFEGAKDLRLDSRGNLIISVEGGELTYKAPKLYQVLGAKRNPVRGRFVLAGSKQVRFEVGDYIRNKELVIDPQIVYSTYLGGSVDDKITAIAVDGTQQAYVTGWSRSAITGTGGFPAATTTLRTPGTMADIGAGGADVFVAKLSANGASLIWLAWMGGALDDVANGIALDKSSPSTPKVFITGTTSSPDFPVAGPAMQACSTLPGTAITSYAFVAEMTQTGNSPSLVYSTCWGGTSAPEQTYGNAIAADSLGAAYVTGTTFASNFPIRPVLNGPIAPYNTMGSASEDAFVLKISPLAVSSVTYSMLLGPSDTITRGNAIAVDTGGQAWVAGQTMSSTLPQVTGHFSSSKVGTSDAFVAEVNATGNGLLYATYINGDVDQAATAIALDNGGATPYNVFVAGWTNSDTGFPSTAYLLEPVETRPVVYQKILQGADDPFVLRLNPNLANTGVDNPLEMVYATHVGASGFDRANALALDDQDDAYIAGWTVSSNWPVAANDTLTPGANGINVTGAVESNTSGGQDAFVAAISANGQTRPFFSYLGASAPPQAAAGIAIDTAHNIYVAGYTNSAIFPLVTGSLMDGSVPAKEINGTGTQNASDGFVTKIAPVTAFPSPLPVSGACTISGVLPAAGPTVGGSTITITGTLFNSLAASGAVQFDGIASSSYTVNASSTGITAVTPRHPLTGSLVAGPVSLTVTTPAGTCSATYAYVTPGLTCTVSSVSPSSGYMAGGTTVTIIGAGFNGLTGPTAVTFGTTNASSYTVDVTSTIITAIAPASLAVSSVPVAVVTATSGTCSGAYSYVITPPLACTIVGSPSSGSTVGGNAVTITGTNFSGLAGPKAVTFDNVAASAYVVNASSTIITATAPRHPLAGSLAAGSVSLVVSPSGASCSTTYNYTVAPVNSGGTCGDDIFYPSPATGPTGTFSYCMEQDGTGRIRIYNVIGDLVAKVEDVTSNAAVCGSKLTAGNYSCRSTLNTGRLAPGVYLYRLEKDYGGGNTVRSSVKKFLVKH